MRRGYNKDFYHREMWYLNTRKNTIFLHSKVLRSLVRYCSYHSNIKFISSRHRVIFSIYLVSSLINESLSSAFCST